jgi:sulfite reductase (NADPH) flavoprotein alpha-component
VTTPPQLIPENAPFSAEQRAWLNGFFAGLLSLEQWSGPSVTAQATAAEENYPWHDPAMPLEERMRLAEDRPLEHKMMAAMGQMDCGQCGYLCKTYAEAIAQGAETDLNLCVPGGRPTARKLKELVANAPAPKIEPASAPESGGWTRKNPFNARLKQMHRMTGEGSVKDTRHVVIDLAGSGLSYTPGDALGIFPRNCPHLVDAILARLGASGEEMVETPLGTRSAREGLVEIWDITKPSDEALACLREDAADPEEAACLGAMLEAGLEEGEDLLDLLEAFPSSRPAVTKLLPRLGRLQPRLYSIASSLRAHRDEAHLTVGVVRYERKARMRKGVASTFFADRLQPGGTLRVYVQPAYHFRLPHNPDTPLIMVGPGTGIAPFRAFLQERRAIGAKGKAWLLFGNPHGATDFLYRDELEGFLREGALARLDTAFSRDQRDKIYVQHRMLEHAREIWAWLEDGAYLYVCGDASKMAQDVHAALHRIAVQTGRMNEDQAAAFVRALADAGRYQRDVY